MAVSREESVQLKLAHLTAAVRGLEYLFTEAGPDALRFQLAWLKKDGPISREDTFRGCVCGYQIQGILADVLSHTAAAGIRTDDDISVTLEELIDEVVEWTDCMAPDVNLSTRQIGTHGAKVLLYGKRQTENVISAIKDLISKLGGVAATQPSLVSCTQSNGKEYRQDIASEGRERPGSSTSGGTDQPRGAARPRWDKAARQLTYMGRVIRDYSRRAAAKQEPLLDEFERQGWPDRIRVESDDRFKMTNLPETAKSFNKAVEKNSIQLFADEASCALLWRPSA